MKNRVYPLLGVLLVAAVGGLLWWSPREPREPVYEGKPIGYWLARHDATISSTRQLSIALGQDDYRFPKGMATDSNAIPFLIEALKRKDTALREAYLKAYMRMWPRIPLSIRGRLSEPVLASVVRGNAVGFLSRMGPMAKPAVPGLIRALKENADDRGGVAWALGNIAIGDRRAMAALTEVAKGKDVNVRQTATAALWKISPEAAAKVLREDESAQARAWAARILVYAGKGDETAIGALSAALNDRDDNVRREATNSFKQIDAEAAAIAGIKMPSP